MREIKIAEHVERKDDSTSNANCPQFSVISSNIPLEVVYCGTAVQLSVLSATKRSCIGCKQCDYLTIYC